MHGGEERDGAAAGARELVRQVHGGEEDGGGREGGEGEDPQGDQECGEGKQAGRAQRDLRWRMDNENISQPDRTW